MNKEEDKILNESPLGNVNFEGYMMKKGKKRYFVLQNSILTWFKHPLEPALGSLDIADYVLEGSVGNAKQFILTPKDFNLKKKKI